MSAPDKTQWPKGPIEHDEDVFFPDVSDTWRLLHALDALNNNVRHGVALLMAAVAENKALREQVEQLHMEMREQGARDH